MRSDRQTEDRLFIRNLAIPCRIGLLEEERSKSQNILIDVEIFRDLRPAGATDDISRTLNYDDIKKRIGELISSRDFNLVEAVGESIATLLLKDPGTARVRVIVRKEKYSVKPAMGIDITRERHD